jgi:hypothetical protein
MYMMFAILNSEFSIKLAPGFTIEGQEHKVLQLRKAIYKLRQAS